MSERSEKLLNGPNQTRFRFTGLFTLQKELLPKDLLLRKVFRETICELTDKTPSLRLGKVTLPRGKLECRSYVLRPRVTNYQLWTLVQCCPEGASGCVGCRRGENILVRITRITRFEVQDSNTACLKGSIIINFKEIAAELKPL